MSTGLRMACLLHTCEGMLELHRAPLANGQSCSSRQKLILDKGFLSMLQWPLFYTFHETIVFLAKLPSLFSLYL